MPVTVALVNDYQVVVQGLETMLEPFADRVRVAELNADTRTLTPVDVTLYDTFAQMQVDADAVEQIIRNPRAGSVVVYSWNVQPQLVQQALSRGCRGYVDKAVDAEQLVEAVEQVAAGQIVVPGASASSTEGRVDGQWPGKAHGLSAREAEVVALITQGMTNVEIAGRAYLSINTVKSYVRSAYQKIGVQRRSQAVRWGMEHGMSPDRARSLR